MSDKKSDNENKKAPENSEALIEDVDYYLNEDGLLVFTEAYHLKRGHCCKNNCKHCPY